MRLPLTILLAVTACVPSIYGKYTSPSKHRISNVQSAHDKAWHDRLKDQLAAAAVSSSSTTTTSKASSGTSTSTKSGSTTSIKSGSTTKSTSISTSGASTASGTASVTFAASAATATDDTTSTFADGSTTSFTLYDSSSLPSPAPPAACASALEATIACNSTVPLMSVYDYLFQSTDLPPVCTTGCATSLSTYRSNVVKSCAGYNVIDSLNNTYAPTYAVDLILAAYDVQCLYDSTLKQYCSPIVNAYNSTGGLLTLPTSQLCTYCTLETLNVTVSNPTSFSYPVRDLLNAAVAQCGSSYSTYAVSGVPSAPITPVGTSTFGVTGPTPLSPQCQAIGTNVSVTTNTTCSALAAQYKVSPNDIRFNNPATVDATCQITAPVTLCIPPPCTLYTVKTNDTCESISAQSKTITGTRVTTVQLISINPELGLYCQSIGSLVGGQICLSPNGGWPSVGVSTTAMPTPSPTTVAPIPSSTGPGSSAACGKWYLTQAGDTCNAIVIGQGITFADFLTVNPEINSNCTNLWLGYNYCVAPYPALSATAAFSFPTGNFSTGTMNNDPLPTTSYTPTFYTQTLDPVGIAAPTNVANGTRTIECGYYYDVENGDTLASIASDVQLNASVLETWNPQLALAAPVVGTSLCVRFPTGNYTLANATRPGNAAPKTGSCAQWYTVATGDSCASIEKTYNLTSAQFSQLNPDINAACTTMQLGVAYCVLSVYAPGYSTAPTPTGPPSNLAAGSFSNCTAYHTVTSGDTCNSMEVAANISATDFLRWNPEVNVTSCTNIQLGAAYCVGGGGNKCSKLYTVASGDYCSKVETAVGLTDAQFRSYNPWLDAGCDMQVGQVMCAGPPVGTTTTTTMTSSTTTTKSSSTTSTTSTPTGAPSNLATGSFANCTTYHTVVSGDTCNSMEVAAGISATDLLRWNPEVNVVTCTNIQLGAAYCVGGGGNQCSKRYTVASGDYCSKVETTVGLTDAQFRSYNTWLDANCDMQVGQVMCVGPTAGGSTTTTTSKSTSTTPPATTTTSTSSVPTNLSTGSWKNCTSYYNVQSGDTCASIDTKYTLAYTDFLRWNPEITKTCTNLGLSSYCVKATPATCKKIYTVASGDYCSKIQTSQSISNATMYGLNPWLDAGCDLQVGQNICVG